MVGRIVDLNPTGVDIDPTAAEWQMVASRRNRGAIDDWVEYLCVRRSAETYEMAVCGFPVDEDGEVDCNAALQPMTDNALFDMTDGSREFIVAALDYLQWPECDPELALQAIAKI